MVTKSPTLSASPSAFSVIVPLLACTVALLIVSPSFAVRATAPVAPAERLPCTTISLPADGPLFTTTTLPSVVSVSSVMSPLSLFVKLAPVLSVIVMS